MEVDKWYIEDLVDACSKNPSGKRKIDIPSLQRRRVWKPYQEDELIETMKLNKISIGALQVYKRGTDKNKDIYVMADGLHRATTLVKYFINPFTFGRTKLLISAISKTFIEKYQKSFDKDGLEEICDKWFNHSILGSYQELVIDKTFNEKIDDLKKIINTTIDKKEKEAVIKYLISKTRDMIKDMDISKSMIPIIINDDITTLPILFKRLNQNGTPLSVGDVLAATWYNKKKVLVTNKEIIQCIKDHYDELREENNNMDIYIDKKEETYTIYEYMLGLKKYLFSSYSDSFFSQIKDPEFIFKLLACCYFDDISKKSIEKIEGKLANEKLTELENKLMWCFDFVVKTYESVIMSMGNKPKLLVREGSFFISVLSLAYKSKNKLEKNIKYFSNLFLLHTVIDKMTDVTFNAKKIKQIVGDKTYMTELNKEEFTEKAKLYIADCLKVTGKRDKVNLTTHLVLNVLSNIKNTDDNLEFGHIVPKKVLVSYNSDKNIHLPINILGNMCLYPKGNSKRKLSQSLQNYITENGMDDSEFYNDYLFIGDNTEHDDIIQRQDLTDKTYINFMKFRMTKMIKTMMDSYKKCFSSEPNNDQSDSDDEHGCSSEKSATDESEQDADSDEDSNDDDTDE